MMVIFPQTTKLSQRLQYHEQSCDKKMEHEAIKTKWGSLVGRFTVNVRKLSMTQLLLDLVMSKFLIILKIMMAVFSEVSQIGFGRTLN